MKGSGFIFDNVNKTYYSCHKITLKRDISYTESRSWFKYKKATMNPKNNNE